MRDLFHRNKDKNEINQAPEEVWDHFRGGSEKAFILIYEHFIDILYNYGERLTRDKELIKDSVQDLFADLWKCKEKLPCVTSVKYYLFKAFKRKVIKKLVRNRKLPIDKNILEDYNFEIVFSHESELISRQISEQEQKRLLRSLNKLPRRQKEAITLKFLDGFSYQEVASIMSMSVKSTYNLIYRALAMLKDHFPEFTLLLVIKVVASHSMT